MDRFFRRQAAETNQPVGRRLFIAIDLPEAVRQRLSGMMSVQPAGVRPVRREQMHLTLHFLGDVGEPSAAELTTALASIRRSSFVIDLGRIGCFPSPRRPAVLWAGVLPNDALADLHAAIGDILTACGLPVESRPFVPHVTLARLSPRVPRSWVADLIRRDDLAISAIPVTAFTLFWSRQADTGSEHLPLAIYELEDVRPHSRSRQSGQSATVTGRRQAAQGARGGEETSFGTAESVD
ncbi:MAG: RNA 2',3'-cyclic phosphodiesterase [Planctomycetia bacterium]